MVDKTLSYLDFTKLLEILKNYACTPYVEERIADFGPLKDPSEISSRQDRIGAIIDVLRWAGPVPLTETPDVREIVRQISIADNVVETRSFLVIARFLRTCLEVVNFLKRCGSAGPFVEWLLQEIDPLKKIHAEITKTIDNEGHIEDTASYELSKIRSDLFLFKERIRKNLEKMMQRESMRPVLQDDYITIRNGRYVLPLKPNFNQVTNGIVHDYSHSLKTSFVEPLEVVEQNNAINILENEEREEVNRVLKELTGALAQEAPVIRRNVNALAELDLYHAIALFSEEFLCVRPEVSLGGELEIKNARNPFIVLSKKDRAVPIDIVMDSGTKAMIISGPNAGGKTAALKTAGLLCAMALSGLFIPASGRPLVPFFERVYAIIGDEQDISQELSSFTAHIISIRDLYLQASGRELVLIDEIGGGTEPQEASALSMGIIDAFVEKGCRIVVTTHLNLLKAYGYTNSFAINVSTTFDQESMRPLYKLIYGLAGYSNALNVAMNLNVPAHIVDRSSRYLGKQEFMLNELIHTLEREKMLVEEERAEMARLKGEIRERLAVLREKRAEYSARIEEKYRQKLEEIEEEIEEIKKEVAKREKDAIRIAKSKLDALKKRHGPAAAVPVGNTTFHIGDQVAIKTLGGNGYITAHDPEKDLYEVVVGNIRTRVHKRHILRQPNTGTRTSHRQESAIMLTRMEEAELNLLGKRVDEALEEVDRFIDKAVVEGRDKIRIVHGIGTGRLMNSVRRHLSELSLVKDFQGDERNAGITIVDLR